MQGQSLLRVAKAGGGSDQPVYSRSDLSQRGFGWSILESWRAGKYLYIRAPKPELYDTTADPAAAHNLAQSSKATMDTMASQLESFDRRFSGQGGKSTSELSSSEMQKLASLGYVGMQSSSGAATTVSGTDPKDKIATANKIVETAPSLLVPSKADRACHGAYSRHGGRRQSLSRRVHAGSRARREGPICRCGQASSQGGWAPARLRLGTLRNRRDSLKTGDFKTAVVHLEIAASRLPAFAPAHSALAQAYEHLGRARMRNANVARRNKNSGNLSRHRAGPRMVSPLSPPSKRPARSEPGRPKLQHFLPF